MLGSVSDADDALQETLLGAWRGLSRFEGRSPVCSWLYRIAANACLRLAASRRRRIVPADYGPARTDGYDLGEPVSEPIWLAAMTGFLGPRAYRPFWLPPARHR